MKLTCGRFNQPTTLGSTTQSTPPAAATRPDIPCRWLQCLSHPPEWRKPKCSVRATRRRHWTAGPSTPRSASLGNGPPQRPITTLRSRQRATSLRALAAGPGTSAHHFLVEKSPALGGAGLTDFCTQFRDGCRLRTAAALRARAAKLRACQAKLHTLGVFLAPFTQVMQAVPKRLRAMRQAFATQACALVGRRGLRSMSQMIGRAKTIQAGHVHRRRAQRDERRAAGEKWSRGFHGEVQRLLSAAELTCPPLSFRSTPTPPRRPARLPRPAARSSPR